MGEIRMRERDREREREREDFLKMLSVAMFI